MDAERLAALHAAKLTALTRDRVGAELSPSPFPGGAAGVGGSSGWLLLGSDADTSLGGALAWGRRVGVDDLHVVVDRAEAAGLLARRAALFARPPTIWRADGPSLVAAEPVPAAVPLPPPDAPDLVALLEDAGLEVVTEDGVVLGEVLGLEVARIEHGPDGPTLAVGVGRFDREATEMTHAHLAPADQVARVVDIVTRYRTPGAPPHPLNQLVPERWLRSHLVVDPGLVGLADLRPVPSAVGRRNLLMPGIASAVGSTPDGARVVVACSTGVDLDLIPAAADDRAAHAPDARLVLAVPARDALPVTLALAGALAAPADVVPLDGEWRVPWSYGD